MARRSSITPWDLECILCDQTTDPKALPLSLLEEITGGFSDEQEIGRGGFAVVYKGKLKNRTVAVKRMSDAYMDENVFHREVECLMTAKHKNVVRFLGYCADRQGSMQRYDGKFVMADVNQRLLCFEYLPKGSLDNYITDMSRGLRWRDRYQIITGICQGLHYLHQKNIVHLDLKPANILLDDNLVPKITDFGISRCFHDIQSRGITTIAGTFGYLAPESFNNTKVTYRHSCRLDIYSLGVVITEILTGERGYQDVDNVVESWSNMLEKSQSDVQLKQVRACAEIGIDCIDSNPAKRPDTEHIINRINEYNEIGVITSQQAEHAPNELHEDTPNALGEAISAESATALAVVETNPYNTFWKNTAKLDMLSETRDALWLSYHQLNPDIRRCMEYCSIFPKGYKLRMVELVHLWIAQGFINTSCATEIMEDVAEGYIQELVSCSFLQPGYNRNNECCFTIHDVLHGLLDKVARNCFRIENGWSLRGGWEGDVPQDVQHLFIQNYDEELIYEKILRLKNLHTLIIDVVEGDTLVKQKVIESICNRLPKLLVLAVTFSREYSISKFSVPESISQLKHLCYLAFRTDSSCIVILPSTLNKLQDIQLLDFGYGYIVELNFGDLMNLRNILCKNFAVRDLGCHEVKQNFAVSNEGGFEVKQLKDLNKLRGSLKITGLENVKSKEEALGANLAAKEQVTELKLCWNGHGDTRCDPEVESEVLESLCPPVGLKKLDINGYEGSRYPYWMVGKQTGYRKELQELKFSNCSQLGPAPQCLEAFPHLRCLTLSNCSWDALADNMEHLTSLEYLSISFCNNIRSLPTLPQSLGTFSLYECNVEFTKTCETFGHPNWEKIKHIPKKQLLIDS